MLSTSCVYNIPLLKPYIKLHIERDGAHDQIFQDLSPFFLGGAWDEATGHVLSSFPVHPLWCILTFCRVAS